MRLLRGATLQLPAAPNVWVKLTERDVERLVTAGLVLPPLPPGSTLPSTNANALANQQRLIDTFCFLFISPWEHDSAPVQVLRLLAEVQVQQPPMVSVSVMSMTNTRAREERREGTTITSRTSVNESIVSLATSGAQAEPPQHSAAPAAGSLLSPQQQYKVELLSPSAQSQRIAADHALWTPAQVVAKGKRKRTSITISPLAALVGIARSQHQPEPQEPGANAPAKSAFQSPRWVTPKRELLPFQQRERHEEPQEPPLKTRRLSASGARVAMQLAASLRALFVAAESDGDDSESGMESDASVASSDATSDLSREANGTIWSSESESDVDVRGNATVLADITEALAPVWSVLINTTSCLQRVWAGVREFSNLPSSYVWIPLQVIEDVGDTENSASDSTMQASTLASCCDQLYAGVEFGDNGYLDEDVEADERAIDGASSGASTSEAKLAVHTRRQRREKQRVNAVTAWRIW